ncbi:MAG: nucleoside deaminase [Acidobacteria bacterium]|nr:nucleoside deaminase [Acidobacteriota bacterium]
MRMAIAKAREGIGKGQSPFGACIVSAGEVLACSHNLVWSGSDITAHAEVSAIRDACARLSTIDLSGSVIYSTCEPCPMCFAACHWARISKIIFGSCIEDAQGCGFSELTIPNQRMKQLGNSPVEVEGDFMRGNCLELFREWTARADRRAY